MTEREVLDITRHCIVVTLQLALPILLFDYRRIYNGIRAEKAKYKQANESYGAAFIAGRPDTEVLPLEEAANAARRAVQAWAQAIDGDDALLDRIATQAAKRELLYAGDTSGTVRLVVRGPVVNRIRIVHLDAAAARNLREYVRRQRDRTGVVPTDRRIVVEASRDQLGDWQVLVLSPLGHRVHLVEHVEQRV